MQPLDFSTPRVMAIVNITPDSFHTAGRSFTPSEVERRIETVLTEGADIIDLGGYSTRPGAEEVSIEEEWRRIALGLEATQRITPHTPVSIDTFRHEIARRSVEQFGPVWINDISGGADPQLVHLAARHELPYIAMHIVGNPQTMQLMTESYTRPIVDEVVDALATIAVSLQQAGIDPQRIILDPGFGFAKSVEQNYALLGGLNRVCALGFPVLAGLSRKSMIYKPLGTTPDEALTGTIALGWEALRQGASILRVHDVREAAESVRLFNLYRSYTRL